MVASTHRVDVEALRSAHPIAPLVASFGIDLRPSGRALVGRCPFHSDGGRPNLYVYPDSNSFYCFRCAAGGDAIEFVRRKENVGFADACRRLAEGTSPLPSLPPQARRPVRRERRWDRLTLEEQVVMNTACSVYQHALWQQPRVLAYLRARNIPDWVTRQGALGYADGHSLEAYLRRRSGLRVAQDLGLLRRPGPGDDPLPLREFLVGRIVVPEIRSGQPVWFIGRSLEDDRRGPKYLALGGERPVLGQERAAGQREAFLCEGVFDYLTAVAWKLPAFSPCGTHLPAERLGFLARTNVVYGVLDGDEAGRAASQRFAEQLGDRYRPLHLPEGCDLNDMGCRPDGRGDFFRLLAAARHQARMEETHGN
ncbi:MAG: CHC2 zinc finger domain-containing protein [Chloroflexi bacterium]|nr:CHC2 zinc finger domain-containing protein [Chloroflexota bacterium]